MSDSESGEVNYHDGSGSEAYLASPKVKKAVVAKKIIKGISGSVKGAKVG